MPAVNTFPVVDADVQLMRDAHTLLDHAAAGDEALLDLAGRYLDHDAPSMPELRSALTARLGERLEVLKEQIARRPEWPAGWIAEGFNHCLRVACEALRFLAANPRPGAGSDRFNAEHLQQLADELSLTLATCFPRAPGSPESWPVLDAPARVGSTVFNPGVSARLVVECAQRSASAARREATMPLEARREQEVARRALWDRLNGPLHVPMGDDILSALAIRLGLPRSDKGAPGQPAYKIFGADLRAFLGDMGVELEQARPVDLQSLRQQLLEPSEPVTRDDDGYWSNPALPLLDEDVNLENFLAAFGIQGAWVAAEDQLEVDEFDELQASSGWLKWTPRPPKGEGWVLLSIHDTEVGPVAGFVRPKDGMST
jgi:hypothetical protein